MGWVELISALAGLGVILLQWWLSSSPSRKIKRERKRNEEIHNAVAARDTDAIRLRIRRLRARD